MFELSYLLWKGNFINNDSSVFALSDLFKGAIFSMVGDLMGILFRDCSVWLQVVLRRAHESIVFIAFIAGMRVFFLKEGHRLDVPARQDLVRHSLFMAV